MKNIYLYGLGEGDCNCIEADWRSVLKTTMDIDIGGLIAHYMFDGEWGIKMIGAVPEGWKIKGIRGECGMPDAFQFVHIQIPSKEKNPDIIPFEDEQSENNDEK